MNKQTFLRDFLSVYGPDRRVIIRDADDETYPECGQGKNTPCDPWFKTSLAGFYENLDGTDAGILVHWINDVTEHRKISFSDITSVDPRQQTNDRDGVIFVKFNEETGPYRTKV